jgi:hypothetical protein
MDTRLQTLLHDLATEMPVDIEGTAPRTLRRARRRRVLNAGAGVAIAVAIVVVSASALRFGDEPTVTPAVTGPNPSATFEGLWPETNADELALTQGQVNDGHYPLRTTPDGTAGLLAVDLLDWQPEDVRSEVAVQPDGHAVVTLENDALTDAVPPIVIGLRQLGRTGPLGVWSVVDVAAGNLVISPETDSDGAADVVGVSGLVGNLYEGAPALEAYVFNGPALEPSVGFTRYELRDRTFGFDVEVSPTPDGRATLLLTMPDANGASLGAVMMSVETPVGDAPTEPSVDVEGVPPDVAITARRIYDAAKAKDFDVLAELLDPNTFVYNLDDGSDPIPAWRADPSELDVMVAILEMPPTSRDIGEGYGTFSFWPYLVNSDFSALTPQERADLAALGYSDEEIQLMIDGGAGYQGPRLAIDEEGQWRNFITVGE